MPISRRSGTIWLTSTPLVDGMPAHPRVRFDRRAQRPRDCLVLRLADVVRIAAVDHPHMQRDPGVKGQRVEHMSIQHDRIVVADDEPEHGVRLTGVHARTAGPETSTAACARVSSIGMNASPKRRIPTLSPERLADRLAQHDRRVLDRVMRVDVDVTDRADEQIESCRARRRPSACGRRTARRWRSRPVRCRRGRGRPAPTTRSSSARSVARRPCVTALMPRVFARSDAHARSSTSFSASVPIVARRYPAMPMSRTRTPASR